MTSRDSELTEKIGTVGVLLGGCSRERAISLRSGQAVYRALKDAGFRVARIDTANGYQKKLMHEKIQFAFPVLHGRGGEDGTIQRDLKKSNIPFVGSEPLASACAFNKIRAKRRFKASGIPTPKYHVITSRNRKRVLGKWQLPFVIKPVCEGSSIDVRIYDSFRPKARELTKLLRLYDELLIEERITGKELTVGVLGKKALPVVEVRPKRSFYDFKSKYTKGLTTYLVPARIPNVLRRRLQSIALRVHQALGLMDFSRVDFMVDQRGRPYVLEVNSIPGFTETSLLPKAAAQIGLSFNDLCVELLQLAYRRQIADRSGKRNGASKK